MDLVIVIAAVGFALLAFELLLPTGGMLAVIGAAGLVAAGVVALAEDTGGSEYFGPGLITLGVLSVATIFVITPKVLRAQRDEPVRTGWEELVGSEGEVREPLDPIGQIYVAGALWRAQADRSGSIAAGSRVRVRSVEGLTLLVEPAAGSHQTASQASL